jgi:hypothetical protein
VSDTLLLEYMTQMPSTFTTHDFRPAHAERAVSVSCHCTWDAIKVRRPPATGFEFVIGFVERCVAAAAGVDTGGRHMFVVLAGEGSFGAFSWSTRNCSSEGISPQ